VTVPALRTSVLRFTACLSGASREKKRPERARDGRYRVRVPESEQRSRELPRTR